MGGLDPLVVRDFGLALLIGALLGVEREKHNAREHDVGFGGIRTFILVAEIGAVAGWLSRHYATPWVFSGVFLGVVAIVVAAYWAQLRRQPESVGVTTEMAALSACVLGALVTSGFAEIAVALAIVNSAILAFKQPLHALVERLGTDDLYAGVQLLVATFVVLPLLPNRAIDPWGALNPYQLWWLVILISTLSLVGYVAIRWFGRDVGTLLTGAFGGLVSSTAVTLALAKQSRDETVRGSASRTLAAGILIGWTIMFARIIVEVAVVFSPLVPAVLKTCGAMGLAALLAAGTYGLRTGRAVGASDATDVPLTNPFNLMSASRFAALFAAVLVIVALVRHEETPASIYAVSALAGLTDVDAITLSMAAAARQDLDPSIAVRAVLIAALANTVVKAGMVAVLGSAELRRPILAGSAAVLAVGVIALFNT